MRAELSREEKLNVLTHGVMAAAFIIWMSFSVSSLYMSIAPFPGAMIAQRGAPGKSALPSLQNSG